MTGTFDDGVDEPNRPSLAEVDYMGNIIGSPTLAGPNFGIQKFAFDSTLIVTESDFNTFLSLYDIVVPNNWSAAFNGQVSEYGKFEFIYQGGGNSLQDPLTISISPKAGADLTGYEFNTVMTFVQPNAAGNYFAAHIIGFTVDSAWWESGSVNPESGYFAVGSDMPLITPEPSIMIFGGVAALLMSRKKKA